MADNFDVLDAAGATKTKAAKDIGAGVLADEVLLVDAAGATRLWVDGGGRPEGATFTSSSTANSPNAQAVATLAGAVGKLTYIEGFDVTFGGATAASQQIVTVAGVAGGTMNYIVTVPAGATAAGARLSVNFNPPIPSSAVNTAIAVTVPALGAGNTHSAVTARGYTL